MTLKKRIYLLIAGALLFILVAPVVLLMAVGYRYDLSAKRILKTGALVVKTDPRDARVFLNQKELSAATPLTKRFLLPGHYEITISKENYRPWHKNISISAGFVTFVPNRDTTPVPLILSSTISTSLSTTTRDLFASGGESFALDGDSIWILSESDPTRQLLLASSTIAMAASLRDYALDNLGQPNFLLDGLASRSGSEDPSGSRTTGWHLHGTSVNPIESKDNQFTNGAQAVVGLLPSGELLRTFGTESFAIDETTLAFTVAGEKIYYLKQTGEGLVQLLEVDNNGQKTLIVASLPEFGSGEIVLGDGGSTFLNLDKEFFALQDGSLVALSTNVDSAQWEPGLRSFVLKRGREIWLYDPVRKEGALVYQASEPLGDIAYNQTTNYIFATEGKSIIAVEVDTLERPNIYVLGQVQNPNPKFVVNQDGNRLYYLDGTNLKGLQIR